MYHQVLSEQYHMQDVLERSDRAMAVVKDIFGDAPRRQTGMHIHFFLEDLCQLHYVYWNANLKCNLAWEWNIRFVFTNIFLLSF